ncbi:ribonuclease H-like domain-containing protein [Tanacetum coccineum]
MWFECILTATYLINRLPSSVLNGKSPYEMIYKKCHSLSHLRVFGCLCFATLINSSDKFGSRSEKCVLIRYYSVNKGYRLYSLDKHQFIFSRDVKFFENIFPFKDSDKIKDATENVFQDVNHINFFDLEYPEIPNDDERVDPNLNCDSKKSQSASSSSSESGGISITADFPINFRNDVDISDNNFATQDEEVTKLEENVFSEGNMDQNLNIVSQDNQNLRRFSRQGIFPKNYNDFIVDSQVKYGIEKYVGYSKLNSKNYCFITQLNKHFEPKSFSEASKFPHWINTMNQEMNSLLSNGTWEIVDLPKGRKAIGSKWIYKIKFQSSGEIDRFKARLVAQNKDVYMRPPKGYFPSGNKTDKGVFLALLVYVDDIIITVIDTDKGICLNQRKYALDLLSEYGMLACKPIDTPLLSKLVISNEATACDPILENITDYQK